MAEPLIQFRNVSKAFGPVRVLKDVSFNIARGECHGLMGENGAGKSTLGKVLAGIHRADAGELIIDGQARQFAAPRDAIEAGVAMVHQELSFCPDLSVAENLSLGRYPRRWRILIDRPGMVRRAEKLLGDIGVELDVTRPMRSLSTAQEQVVQIAAALGSSPRILVFDEPTSSLSEPEAQRLFTLIEELKKRGLTMIYVSHRMPELFRLCDKISVLRDGQYVGTLDRGEMSEDAVVRMMIGRSLEEYLPRPQVEKPGEIVLSARRITSPGSFRDINFDLRAGEILGFAGLVGAGRSEVAQAIFGLDPRATGEVKIGGETLKLGSTTAAMRAGVGLVPEDRKRRGAVLGMSSRANISMAMLDRLQVAGFLQQGAERALASDYFQKLSVRAASPEAPVGSLSGGNQQKIVIAKWLARGGRVLIVDEPTRGVDVGAKAAIHALIDDLAEHGLAIILISSELPEVLRLSTRMIVMREGRFAGELTRAEATQDAVLRLMAGAAPQSVTAGDAA